MREKEIVARLFGLKGGGAGGYSLVEILESGDLAVTLYNLEFVDKDTKCFPSYERRIVLRKLEANNDL